MKEFKTMWELIRGVAEKLSGRKIILRMEIPEETVSQRVDGRVMRLNDNKAIMYLNPNTSEERLLYILCHEIAHAKLDFFSLAEVSLTEATNKKQTRKLPGFSRESREENRADLLASRWYDYALKRGNDLEEWLFSLLEMENEK